MWIWYVFYMWGKTSFCNNHPHPESLELKQQIGRFWVAWDLRYDLRLSTLNLQKPSDSTLAGIIMAFPSRSQPKDQKQAARPPNHSDNIGWQVNLHQFVTAPQQNCWSVVNLGSWNCWWYGTKQDSIERLKTATRVFDSLWAWCLCLSNKLVNIVVASLLLLKYINNFQ